MYNIIKWIVRFVVPISVFFKVEGFLRYFHYLLYKGNKYQCNICNKKLKSFQPFGTEQICPSCGSLGRNRRLFSLLKGKWINEKINVLDFSPSRCIYRNMKRRQELKYFASDLSGKFISDYQFDIRAIATSNEFFDLIICYHILEHVIEDIEAMQELYRVLKLGGYCIVQTPFKEGNIYENYTVVTEDDRRKHFGQEDHVRIYSVEGLKNRLCDVGFSVEILTFNELSENYFGFDETETVLVCKK